MNCSHPQVPESGLLVLASDTVIEVDLRPDEDSRVGGYLIRSKVAVKKGDSLPTLLLITKGLRSIMSLEAEARKAQDADTAEPMLTIASERLKPEDQASILQAWRQAQHVRKMLSIPGMF